MSFQKYGYTSTDLQAIKSYMKYGGQQQVESGYHRYFIREGIKINDTTLG